MSLDFLTRRSQLPGVCVVSVLLIVICIALVVVISYRHDVSQDKAATIERRQETLQALQTPQSSQVGAVSQPERLESELSVIRDLPCPVKLPSDCTSMQSCQGANLESWQALSKRDCRVVARELLLELQDGGAEMIRAGYLDLSDKAWGCTAQTSNEEALIISLIPEQLGSPRGEGNRLIVTVMRIAQPGLGQESEKE